MALEAQWLHTPPLCISAHAIAISLGALKAPEQEAAIDSSKTGSSVPSLIHTAEELADFDDPATQKFLQQLGAALG